MSRIIKYNQVTFAEEAQLIDVLTKNYFNPNISSSLVHEADSDGFTETDFAGGEQDEDFVDPELLIKNAEEEAASLIKNATEEADLIIQKAKLTVAEEKEQARAEGYNEGFEQGRAEAEQQHEQILIDAQQTLDDAFAERAAILESIEEETINLVANIAEKLVGGAILLNPEVILYIMRTGLAGIPDAEEITVRVSKDDFETASKMQAELMQYVDSDTNVTIVKDTGLNPGDCVIDTPIGSIDSSLNKQWQSLKTDLFMLLRG